MLTEELKKDYLALIGKLEVDAFVKKSLSDFITTYDGTNEKELNLMILSITTLLLKFGELIIVAEGFEQLDAVNEEVKAEIRDIGEEFKNIEAGNFPVEPPVSTNTED